jgi:hypothetical protein
MGSEAKASGATRRNLLRAGMGGCAAVALNAARAEEADSGKSWKVSKESVHYVDKGAVGGAQVCITCHYFVEPTECLVVEGFVSPHGYCDFYVD